MKLTPPQLLLRDKDKQMLQQLVATYLPTVTVWAYGSRVTGDAHDASDLDIVLRSRDLNPIPRGELNHFLEALRESNLPILVDARDWARLPASFQKEIGNHHLELENHR